MTRIWFSLLLGALALQLTVTPAVAGRFDHCECVGDYEPPHGVVKWYTVKKKKEWEYRNHCLPCGRKIPYKVQVITYVDRYSDGTKRTWKCDVVGSEITLGK